MPRQPKDGLESLDVQQKLDELLARIEEVEPGTVPGMESKSKKISDRPEQVAPPVPQNPEPQDSFDEPNQPSAETSSQPVDEPENEKVGQEIAENESVVTEVNDQNLDSAVTASEQEDVVSAVQSASQQAEKAVADLGSQIDALLAGAMQTTEEVEQSLQAEREERQAKLEAEKARELAEAEATDTSVNEDEIAQMLKQGSDAIDATGQDEVATEEDTGPILSAEEEELLRSIQEAVDSSKKPEDQTPANGSEKTATIETENVEPETDITESTIQAAQSGIAEDEADTAADEQKAEQPGKPKSSTSDQLLDDSSVLTFSDMEKKSKKKVEDDEPAKKSSTETKGLSLEQQLDALLQSAPANAAADLQESNESEAEDVRIEDLDAELASSAEDAVGEFESVDEVLSDLAPPSAKQTAADVTGASQTDTIAREQSDGNASDDLAGSFESPEEIMAAGETNQSDASNATQAAGDTNESKSQVEPASESPESADELEGAFETADDVLNEKAQPATSGTAEAVARELSQDDQDQLTSSAPQAPLAGEESAKPAKSAQGLLTRLPIKKFKLPSREKLLATWQFVREKSKLIGPVAKSTCAIVSKPMEMVSPQVRDMIGYAGLLTLFNAIMIFLAALFLKIF